ncbi:MAG TPA: protein arginine kinase [Firmicutes bacterium]|nr:protein arginine kinase [Bacillota bacterium]
MQQERRSEIVSKWMEGTGPEAEIVISSRIRLARNIRKMPFPPLASDEQREKILQTAKDVLRNSRLEESGFGIMDISVLSPVFRQVLVEKHLISPLLSRENRFSALMLRKDEIISIMVNEEDHFRIQCLLPGLQLEKAWQEASRYDDILESHLDYAFDEEKGYLTACPTNVGTGLRASVMLHLPALAITQQINRILSAVSQVGLAVRGLYGEGTEMTGNLFQISNQITLGQSEEEILQNLYGVTSQLINQEKSAREHLLNEGREKLGDRAGRAYGILKNAWMLSSREAMQFLSDVRLGVDLGLLKGVPLKILNELLVLIRPGCLQYLKDKNLGPYERDLERAIQIQKCLP